MIKILLLLFLLFSIYYKILYEKSYFSSKIHEKYLFKNFSSNIVKKEKINIKNFNIKYCDYSFIESPLPKDFHNFPTKISMILLIKENKLIGRILGSPWFYKKRPVYIVDNLWVHEKHRKKGLGEYLIKELSSKLLCYNGLGIFTTYKKLDFVKENQLLSIVYFYEPLKIKNYIKIQNNNEKINIEDLKIPKFIFDQELFNVKVDYIKKYLHYFCSLGNSIYKVNNSIIGVIPNNKINSEFDQIAWYWGKLSNDFGEKHGCIMPFLKKKYNKRPWDRACTYIYGDFNKCDIKLRDVDIYGWFLPK